MATQQVYMEAFTRATEKLRRRLFRKPATGESVSIFRSLKDALAEEGELRHAAFCACAVARCEEALSRPFHQASEYSQAGAMLLNQQLTDEAQGVARGDELVDEAMQCFLLAAKAYDSQGSPVAFTVLEQLAMGLEAAGRHNAAAAYFAKAGQGHMRHGSEGAAMRCFEQSFQCHFKADDYEAAAAALERLGEVIARRITMVQALGADGATERGMQVEQALSLFLVRIIQREREAAKAAMLALIQQLPGQDQQALTPLLQGCMELGDGHDPVALKKVLSEVQLWLSEEQLSVNLLRLVLEAATDRSFLQ